MGFFVGRDKELAEIESFFESGDSYVLCLYGRQGIGKTTLIREALKARKYIIYNAVATTDWGIVSELAGLMMETFPEYAGNSTLQKLQARQYCAFYEYKGVNKDTAELLKDYSKAFEYLLKQLSKLSKKAGLVVVIDNYPELVKGGRFAEILAGKVADEWPKENVKLVLMSDSNAQAEKNILSQKCAWKNTPITALELGPISFYSAKAFYGEAKPADAVFFYGITGGIPAYLERVYGNTASREDAIRAVFFDAEEKGLLNAVSVLKADLREFAYYNRLLSLLAAGNMRVNRLADVFEKPKDIVVPYLTTLMTLGLVTKENPVTEPTNRRKTRYQIVNSYDLFYYKYIASNMNLVYERRWDDILAIIKDNLADYMHLIMTDVCKEYIGLASGKGEFGFAVDAVGNWWENDDEAGTTQDFDMVALGRGEEGDSYIFGRCYCEDKPVDISMLKSMLDLTKHVPREGNMLYVMFAANGFHENVVTASRAISNIRLISIEEMASL